jgi:hypothetical protein
LIDFVSLMWKERSLPDFLVSRNKSWTRSALSLHLHNIISLHEVQFKIDDVIF